MQCRPPWTASPSQSIALSYHHCEYFPWPPEVLKLHPVQNAQPLLSEREKGAQPSSLILSRTHNLHTRRNPNGQERGRKELMNTHNNLAKASCSRAQTAESLNFTQMFTEPCQNNCLTSSRLCDLAPDVKQMSGKRCAAVGISLTFCASKLRRSKRCSSERENVDAKVNTLNSFPI